jgi:hypothetical protein
MDRKDKSMLTETRLEKHTVAPENAAKFKEWIASRGGVAVWRSADLSDPALSMSSPALDREGNPTAKPHWKLENTPYRVITNPDDIEVITGKEVKRFHIGVRMGSQGLSLKVTDGSTRRIHAAVSKAGDGAWYEFDFDTQEAIIFAPGAGVILSEWHR